MIDFTTEVVAFVAPPQGGASVQATGEVDMMRWVGAWLLAGLGLCTCLPTVAQELRVGITDRLQYLDVVHDGKKVRIQRVQDVQHRLTDSWARTSRPCPPACVQPLRAAPGVDTVAELELLDFLDRPARAGTGLLLDVRAPELYRVETIPGATSLPFTILTSDNPHLDKVLGAMGARRAGVQWTFDDARELLLFCSGPWSDDAAKAIRAILALGYPPGKIKYYRGGLQSWRSLGLTTVVPARTP